MKEMVYSSDPNIARLSRCFSDFGVSADALAESMFSLFKAWSEEA